MHTSGIVVLTTIVNALTFSWVLKKLGLNKIPKTKRREASKVVNELNSIILKTMQVIVDEDTLSKLLLKDPYPEDDEIEVSYLSPNLSMVQILDVK